LLCILVARQQYILRFPAFTSRIASLLASTRVPVFFFVVSMLRPGRLTSSALTSGWCVPFNFSPTSFVWEFLMAYSVAMLRSNGVKASPSVDHIWLESYQKIFTLRKILYFSFKPFLSA
jgi:hypothetical protein